MPRRQLEKIYDPKQVEERWYRFWTDRNYFHASTDHPGQPYSIVIPPPNITGSLHIGHALNNTLQDILVRWRRMQGRNTLWLPGTDHAGIATQNVVEKQLREQEGLSREELGRERFIERVWTWKAQSGGTIIEQLKRLGASCDWDRLRFTLDEGLSAAVREVFVRLHEDGLIYRGERLINWCPRCLTALSDIEVEHETTTGKLYHIAYPLADDPQIRLIVATTRPETMLGDTAVAVHPEDDRYASLIGRKVRLPLTTREIPIVGDPILVDRQFGTGVVKITPAHDFNDFEAGVRHKLPRVPLFDQHARLDPDGLQVAGVEEAFCGKLATLPVRKARPLVEQFLRERHFLTTVEPHGMSLGKCYRCKTVVEPYLSPQWFVKIKPLAEPAIKAVEEGRIRLIPEAWINNYLAWMRDIRDWCISRQIWWGHQIPAWYCRRCNADALIKTIHGVPDSVYTVYTRLVILPSAKPLVAKTQPASCPSCGGKDFVRDPDVLDTWFSSALWPFSTLGWPEQTPELKAYYPTSTLVTGFDILFFWVARMIMMGLKLMGEVPFRDVYIHALVRDIAGQKMSKSKGNVIDPLVVMDKYGADALRFTLASMASPGRDVKLAEERIEGYRNFANKIWNAARFIVMNLDGPREAAPPAERSFPDRWILSRLNRALAQVTASLEQYRFDQACSHLYQFIWHEYCDWYLELIKPALSASTGLSTGRVEGPALLAGDAPDARRTRHTLIESFETMLRLLHPIMPFVSEEIWQTLPHEGESIVVRPYPEPVPAWEAKDAEAAFALLERSVTLARTGRSLLNYSPGQQLRVYVGGSADHDQSTLKDLKSHIEHHARGSVEVIGPIIASTGGKVEITPELLKAPGMALTPRGPKETLWLTVDGLTVGVQVEGQVDLHKALEQVVKRRGDSEKEATRIAAKLDNAEFTGKAPPEVVAEHKQRLRTLLQDSDLLASSEEQLRAMAGIRQQ